MTTWHLPHPVPLGRALPCLYSKGARSALEGRDEALHVHPRVGVIGATLALPARNRKGLRDNGERPT
jgi:hypothetical protein